MIVHQYTYIYTYTYTHIHIHIYTHIYIFIIYIIYIYPPTHSPTTNPRVYVISTHIHSYTHMNHMKLIELPPKKAMLLVINGAPTSRFGWSIQKRTCGLRGLHALAAPGSEFEPCCLGRRGKHGARPVFFLGHDELILILYVCSIVVVSIFSIFIYIYT